MLDESLDILFSPSEANIDKARNSTQNHWQDGFMFLFVAVFFSGLLQAFSSLLALVFVRKGILTDPTMPPNTPPMAQLMDVVVSVAINAVSLPLLMFLSLVFLVVPAYLLGGRGSLGQLFFVRVLYTTPISVVGGVWSILIVLAGALTVKLNQPAILITVAAPLLCFVPLTFYFLFLDYLAVKVVYSLSSGRAAMVVLLPLLLAFLPILCCASLLLMGPFLNEVTR